MAARYDQNAGQHFWYTAPSGTAGTAITFTQAMTLDASGNLGLGVTPSAWYSSYRGIQLYGGTIGTHTAARNFEFITNGYHSGSGAYTYLGSDYANMYVMDTGKHIWYNAASGTAGNPITFTQAMTLDASGNLGIGTSSPAEKLTVFSGTNNSTIARFTGGQSAKGLVIATYSSNGNDGGVSLSSTDSLSLFTASAERLRIDSSGNVLVTGAGGLGYGTGSGGTVTQATSRTTGVTLNKTNGAITLVSAAGSTSWQSFTVTNSTVAATDTVIVNQKSGTDLNEIHVTAVAAGSFRISFKTTGGTTTEQPVFNFAVIKAVTA